MPGGDRAASRPASSTPSWPRGWPGFERVGLASVVELLLGFTLEKGYSAADWSTRPLPHGLAALRRPRRRAADRAARRCSAPNSNARASSTGREQEFAAAVSALPKPPPAEPWRRTSGIHRVRSRRQLALVRALWYARDDRARSRDIAPGRVLPDAAIVAAALAAPKTAGSLAALPVFSGPRMRRTIDVWWEALSAAAELPDSELPGPAASTGLPPAGSWSDRDPDAAARLAATRAVLKTVAAEPPPPGGKPAGAGVAAQDRVESAGADHAEIDRRSLVAGGCPARGRSSWCADVLVPALTDPAPIVAAAEEAARIEAEAAAAAAQSTGGSSPQRVIGGCHQVPARRPMAPAVNLLSVYFRLRTSLRTGESDAERPLGSASRWILACRRCQPASGCATLGP